MTFKQFIKNHVKVAPGDKRIRSNNGNTFSIKEVDGNMIIINE